MKGLTEKEARITPYHPPPVYSGDRVLFYMQFDPKLVQERKEELEVVLSGYMGSKLFSQSLSVPISEEKTKKVNKETALLTYLFGHSSITDLEKNRSYLHNLNGSLASGVIQDQVKQQTLKTSLQTGILCKETAFVAVEERDGQLVSVPVVQNINTAQLEEDQHYQSPYYHYGTTPLPPQDGFGRGGIVAKPQRRAQGSIPSFPTSSSSGGFSSSSPSWRANVHVSSNSTLYSSSSSSSIGGPPPPPPSKAGGGPPPPPTGGPPPPPPSFVTASHSVPTTELEERRSRCAPPPPPPTGGLPPPPPSFVTAFHSVSTTKLEERSGYAPPPPDAFRSSSSSPRAPSQKVNTNLPIASQLVQNQKANGSFQESALSVMGITLDQLKSNLTDVDSAETQSIFLTALVCAYLKEKCNKEKTSWTLVVKKATNWLKKETERLGLPLELFESAAFKLISSL